MAPKTGELSRINPRMIPSTPRMPGPQPPPWKAAINPNNTHYDSRNAEDDHQRSGDQYSAPQRMLDDQQTSDDAQNAGK